MSQRQREHYLVIRQRACAFQADDSATVVPRGHRDLARQRVRPPVAQ